MKNFKRKVRYLLNLCIAAQEKGIDVKFSYTASCQCVDLNYFENGKITKNIYNFLDHDNAEEKLNEQIKFMRSLIEGDKDVHTR